MKITIEPTAPQIDGSAIDSNTKVSIEVKGENLPAKEILKHMIRALQACGYTEESLVPCLSDEFAETLGFFKIKNDSIYWAGPHKTADAISKDFISLAKENNDSIFSYNNTIKD